MNIKEKWETVKAKACETKEKVKNWYAENKEIVNVTALVAGAYGGLLAWSAIAGKKAEEHEAFTTGFNNNDGIQNYGMTESKESYRENWEAVNLFAKSLKLEPGEVYIIEGKDGTITDMVTSHLLEADKVSDMEITF